MKSTILILYISLTIFSACNSKEFNNSHKEDKIDSFSYDQQNRTLQGDTLKKLVIDNDAFIFASIENALSLAYFKDNFKEIQSQVIPNKHNNTLSDTVLIYTNGIDTVNFYVSTSNIILQEALINSEEIILDSRIRIGMSKEGIREKFDLKNLPDSLVVKDFENSSYFLFIFKDDRLRKVNYSAKYLD